MEFHLNGKIVKMDVVPVHQIKPYENNVKFHPVQQLQGLTQSISDFGFKQPIVVDRNNVIVAGHARYEVAATLGYADILCVLADDLTDEEINAYRLLDNEIAKQGTTDLTKLQAELEKMPDFDFDKFNIEFPTFEKIEPVDGLCDEDEVPELKIEAISKLGDIWILGNHRLMCGDSTMIDDVEKLMNGYKADMVFTDPPYGISYQGKMRKKTPQFEVLANDDKILDIAPIVYSFLKDDSAAFIWTSHNVYPQWRLQFEEFYKNTIVWYKAAGGMGDLQGNYATDYELALFCVKGKIKFNNTRGMAVWRIDKDSNSLYEHPTQKPVALAEKAISDLTSKNNLVMDLFGGSGSTLIACEKTNRHCFMSEIDPRYVDTIINRWQKFTGKQAIHEETKKTFDELSPLV